MGTYTFKRVKIRQPETWNLTDVSLSRDGETIVLDDITEVMFEQAATRIVWVTVMKVVTREKTYTLQCNDNFSGPNRQQFLSLVHDTVHQLSRSGSTATVRQGKGAAIGGWMMVFAGLVFLFGGLLFIKSVISGGGATPFIIGGIAALIGALFVKMGEPWKAPPDVDLAGLSQQLANIRTMMTRK
ncbi:MAG: hypothetical protein AAF098_19020 [Pseudomonadota bacterium]